MSEAAPLQYEVADRYSGPLDLLLFLVRRNEIAIEEFPVASIARQFSEMVEVVEFLDLDAAGEFVVLASTLTEIKSRAVLPTPAEESNDDEPEVEETHEQLVEQLLAYKRYRDAAIELEARAAEWRDRFPRLSSDRPDTDRDQAADRIRDVELWDLVSALGRILRVRDVPTEGRVQHDRTPIHVYVERIGAEVRATGEATFSSFFEGENDRHRIVAVFLAILELIRHHGFRGEQDVHGEIRIRPPIAETPEGDAV